MNEIYKNFFKGIKGFAEFEAIGKGIDLTVERCTAIRGIAIEVYTSHEVKVRAEQGTGIQAITEALKKHRRFIINRLRYYSNAIAAQNTIPLFAHGEKITICGKRYIVERREDICWARIEGYKILVPMKAGNYSELRDTVKRLAYQRLKAMTDAFAELYGFTYSSIHINQRKTAWGDCDTYKRIGYNISLAFLPENLVEYVVVHELAHTREMNHGKNFWAEVRRVLPDYKDRVEAMKSYNVAWYLDRIT